MKRLGRNAIFPKAVFHDYSRHTSVRRLAWTYPARGGAGSCLDRVLLGSGGFGRELAHVARTCRYGGVSRNRRSLEVVARGKHFVDGRDSSVGK